MYFNEEQINSLLLSCKYCESRLDEPRILPCGENICSICSSSIKVTENEFECLVCKMKHEMPKLGRFVHIKATISYVIFETK
jgi:hypothetical protein